MKFKRIILSLMSLLFIQATQAQVLTCPGLTQISKTPGEYSWKTTLPGWEGAFIDPQTGLGHSNQVTRFIAARWIQFSNLPDSPGYIQCDYAGDLANETIRFVQKGTQSTHKPNTDNWSTVQNFDFPSVQKECSVSLELCQFEQK